MIDRTRWFYDRERLREALARWHTIDPLDDYKALVDGALMDLLRSPLLWGKQDGETGVFAGWAGDDIVIVYVPNDDGRISIADINFG